jgi:hypothetical protein
MTARHLHSLIVPLQYIRVTPPSRGNPRALGFVRFGLQSVGRVTPPLRQLAPALVGQASNAHDSSCLLVPTPMLPHIIVLIDRRSVVLFSAMSRPLERPS